MRRVQKNGRARGTAVSTGAHQEVSPLARATRTKTRGERREQLDRKDRARGWECGA